MIPANSAGPTTATRQNCFVDENGKCRKILNLRGRIDISNTTTGVEDKEDTDGEADLKDSDVMDLILWLQQFKKPRLLQ